MVEAQITTPPISVERLGTSAKISQPSSDAHTRSRNLTDWVAEMSATANERAMTVVAQAAQDAADEKGEPLRAGWAPAMRATPAAG